MSSLFLSKETRDGWGAERGEMGGKMVRCWVLPARGLHGDSLP